jgi:hypothetical protein
MGGMLAATFLAIFFVPFFFKLIMERRFGERRSSEELKAGGDASPRDGGAPAHPRDDSRTPRTEGSDD